MNDYCIQIRRGRVAVSRIVAGKPEAIRFQGETWLASDKLWPRFKDKIEYSEGEQIALLILSDDESFAIDPAITIAEKFDCTNDEIIRIVNTLSSPGDAVLIYPDIDLRSSALIKRQQGADITSGDDMSTVDQKSLQGFFLRKTQEYKRD